MDPHYDDYVAEAVHNDGQNFVYSVPIARNINAVSSVRVYFPMYGLLGQSSDMALKIDVYGNGVLKGTTTVDGDTVGANELAYVDIPVTDFGQTEADAVSVTFTLLVATGIAYPEPNIYSV